MDADGRRERPVEFSEPTFPEPLHFHECRGRIRNQRRNVDALTSWRERREIAHAARQHIDRAMVIQTTQVMERDADLKNALIEKPDLTIFSPPQPFECLVLLEVLAPIELCNPFQQQKRRKFVTGRHHTIPSSSSSVKQQDQVGIILAQDRSHRRNTRADAGPALEETAWASLNINGMLYEPVNDSCGRD